LSKILLRILFIVAILAGLGLSLLAPIDEVPYQQKPYYTQMLHSLDSLQQQLASRPGDTLQAGWSRQNITPDEPLKLMGYGWKGNYKAVHDSLMLRCFVFDDGRQKVALLSYDLMIVHPDLAAAVQRGVDSSGLSVDGLYFTAVHTHKGYGEWAKGLGGKLTAGGYNEDLVAFIVQQTLSAIRLADARKKPAKIGYASYAHPELIRNRLTKDGGSDDLLRVMQLQRHDGNMALLCTFAAHATFINSRSLQLSADYPASLVQALEQHADVDFAAFAAGAVGSHSPYYEGKFSYQKMQSYAEQLAEPVLSDLHNLPLRYVRNLQYLSVPLALGEPQLKIAAGWRVRPWLFQAFFGALSSEVTVLSLGDIALLGVPADFSGMLYKELNARGLKIMATSFNGSYIGYVIPDEHYHLPHREARELNWFGPYTGSYVTEVMNRSLNLLTQ
jgi:neutral ceramidase